MAKYIEYKSKKFKLQKDGIAWAKKIKASFKGAKTMKVETNYNANNELEPWTAIVLMKQ